MTYYTHLQFLYPPFHILLFQIQTFISSIPLKTSLWKIPLWFSLSQMTFPGKTKTNQQRKIEKLWLPTNFLKYIKREDINKKEEIPCERERFDKFFAPFSLSHLISVSLTHRFFCSLHIPFLNANFKYILYFIFSLSFCLSLPVSHSLLPFGKHHSFR